MNIITNKPLHDSLLKATVNTFLFYNTAMVIKDEYKSSPEYLIMALHNCKQTLSERSFIKDTIELLKTDSKIRAYQGKIVATQHLGFGMPEECDFILSFINHLYLIEREFSEKLFETKYQHLEDFFYTDHFETEDECRLFNFEFDDEEINLGDGLKITKSIYNNSKEFDLREIGNYSHISKSDFIIKRCYKEPKVTSDVNASDEIYVSLQKNGPTNSNEIFDLIITTLRLFKSSAVYRDNLISSKILTFHPYSGVVKRGAIIANTVIGQKCAIMKTEGQEIIKKYNQIASEKNSRFVVALNRLTTGHERTKSEDRLIDFMIGLETLYLPDGNAELSFRLSMRVSYLLFSSTKDRKETYLFLRDMYKIRSQIVHGSEYEISILDVNKIEDYLRKSINLWLIDKQNFTVNKYSNSGKLQIEGKLDTLFFE